MIGETKTMKTDEKCCYVHAQIEYTNLHGESVESLVGFSSEGELRSRRQELHDMLDEWIDRRNKTDGPDHFIVFDKLP